MGLVLAFVALLVLLVLAFHPETRIWFWLPIIIFVVGVFQLIFWLFVAGLVVVLLFRVLVWLLG